MHACFICLYRIKCLKLNLDSGFLHLMKFNNYFLCDVAISKERLLFNEKNSIKLCIYFVTYQCP